jgi:GntR family transcriptional regulator
MLDSSSSKPLYEQIKDYLLQNIQTGVYGPDQRIPSERALSETFGVNRLTVQKAVNELIQVGCLYVRRGKGTYVRRGKFDQQLENLTSFTEEMSKRGQNTSSRLLKSGYAHASFEEARILHTAPGVPLLFLVRLRLADNIPMAIEHSRLLAARCPGLLNGHDFERESLYDVLQRVYGIPLTHADQSIEARKASEEEAQLLGIEPGDPILHLARVTYTEGDQPIEYVQSSYCGARYTFQAVLRHL